MLEKMILKVYSLSKAFFRNRLLISTEMRAAGWQLLHYYNSPKHGREAQLKYIKEANPWSIFCVIQLPFNNLIQVFDIWYPL